MSHLSAPSPIFSNAANSRSPTSLRHKKQHKMSIPLIYGLAHKARAKLSRQVAMPDHDLRLLVGHANLLDFLMLELADAEREQESWLHQSVRGNSQATEKATADKHIQWIDTVNEADEADHDGFSSDEDSDSDLSDDDEDDDLVDMAMSLRRVPSYHNMSAPAHSQIAVVEVDMEGDVAEDEDDYADLTLTRSPSHHSAPAPPLPELEDDLESSSSEDEAMPPSPSSIALPTFDSSKLQHSGQAVEQQQARIAKTCDDHPNTIHYMPVRNPDRLVSAISVY